MTDAQGSGERLPAVEVSSSPSPHARRKYTPKRVPAGGISVFPVEIKRGSSTLHYWRATQIVTIGDYKQRVKRQARTQQEAIGSLTQAVLELRVGYGQLPATALPIAPKYRAYSFDELLDTWLARKKNEVKPGSFRAYESRVRHHIEPEFSGVLVRHITEEDCEEFFNKTLPDKGLGVESIRQVYRSMKGVFDYALKKKIITDHPMADLSQPKQLPKTAEDKTRMRQAAYLLEKFLLKYAAEADADPNVPGTHHEARWLIGMLGFRQSEVLGLTDASLVEGRRLIISHQLTRIAPEHGCGVRDRKTRQWPCGRTNRGCSTPKRPGYWELASTKSASSVRSVILPKHVWDLLLKRRRQQVAFRKTAAFKPEPGEGIDQLLFTKPDGKPIYGQADREALYELIGRITTLPKGVTVHTLRHAATTLLIAEGADRQNIISHMGWNPKNGEAQLATYDKSDAAVTAEVNVATYIQRIYPSPTKKELPKETASEVRGPGFTFFEPEDLEALRAARRAMPDIVADSTSDD